MKRIVSMIPERMRLPLIVVLAWDLVVYSGSRLVTRGMIHYNMSLALDGQIPLIPWTASIYLVCYAFWVVNYILAVRQREPEAFRFVGAELLAKTVSLVFFLLLPTTMIRPAVTGSGFWNDVMRLIYRTDAADNLFPSLHCMISWFCFIGVRKNPEIPRWYRVFSLVFALAVCVSTVTTKQHVLVDIGAGIALAELCYWIAGTRRFRRLLPSWAEQK